MPSVSKKQHDLMKRAAKDKTFAKEKDIKQKMAREWVYQDMALAATDQAHADLIGVSQEKALDYLSKHSDPSKESQPASLDW